MTLHVRVRASLVNGDRLDTDWQPLTSEEGGTDFDGEAIVPGDIEHLTATLRKFETSWMDMTTVSIDDFTLGRKIKVRTEHIVWLLVDIEER